jgi:hypothetical protein
LPRATARLVSTIRGAASPCDSVNVVVGHSGSRQHPRQPPQDRDAPEARRIMQDPGSAAVADRHHPACRAGGLELTRLDGEHQPLLVVDLNIEHVHVGNIEDRISAANAPQSITVTWANGATEVVPLSKFTGGVAHYVTTSNLDSTVVSATAVIYAGWSGQFNLSHGPCGVPTPSSTPTSTPTS